jgi:hypothetical protein
MGQSSTDKLATLGTQDTGRRGNQVQTNWQRGVHKTQDEDKQSRDTVNVGYTKTQDEDNPETLSTRGTQDTGRRQTI